MPTSAAANPISENGRLSRPAVSSKVASAGPTLVPRVSSPKPSAQGRRAATPATTTSRSSEWCSSANPRTAARLSSDPSSGLGRVAQLTDVLLGGAGCFEERLLKRCGAGREFVQHQTDVGRQLAYPRRIDAAQGG